MFIDVTEVNGITKPIRVGLRHIVTVEPYDEPSEPQIRAVITLVNRVLNVSETAATVNFMIDSALSK